MIEPGGSIIPKYKTVMLRASFQEKTQLVVVEKKKAPA